MHWAWSSSWLWLLLPAVCSLFRWPIMCEATKHNAWKPCIKRWRHDTHFAEEKECSFTISHTTRAGLSRCRLLWEVHTVPRKCLCLTINSQWQIRVHVSSKDLTFASEAGEWYGLLYHQQLSPLLSIMKMCSWPYCYLTPKQMVCGADRSVRALYYYFSNSGMLILWR